MRQLNFAQEQLSGRIQGVLLIPVTSGDWGILVLGGSSGRVDIQRASLFANCAVTSLALRWFGGDDQAPGICEIPLETFIDAITELQRRGCKRIAVIGTSKGAEAALLTAIVDPRIEAVFAISPTSVVWGNIGAGRDGIEWPERSSWTWQDRPLPFVPANPSWPKDHREGLVSYRRFFEHCLDHFASCVPAATIEVERSDAKMVFIAGDDDALWPSGLFARSLINRLRSFGKAGEHICDEHAGHRILLPGETTPKSSVRAHGGNDEADARLGSRAWNVIASCLQIEGH